MEDRLEIHEKINMLKAQIISMEQSNQPVPEKNIVCVFYGSQMRPRNEICRQLCRNMKLRYQSENAFFCLYLKEALAESVRAGIQKMLSEGGMSAKCYYVPVIFLVSDESVQRLGEFVHNLSYVLRKEGITDFHVDCYGLLDYGNENIKTYWKASVPSILHMLDKSHEVDDLYMLSRNENGNQNIFSRALAAIEMNIYLKSTVKQMEELETWKVPESLGLVKDENIRWKALSYWRFDIVEYLICRIIQKLLEWQLLGCTEQYRRIVTERLDRFWKNNEWRGEFLKTTGMLPVRVLDMEEIISPSEFFFFMKKKKASLLSNKEVLKLLYKDENFLEVFSKNGECIQDDLTEELIELLLGYGTVADVQREFPQFIQEQVQSLQEEEKNLEKQLQNADRYPAACGTKDYVQFLDRFHEEYVIYHKKLYWCRWKKQHLLSVQDRFRSSAFQNLWKKQVGVLKDRLNIVCTIMSENMVCNEAALQKITDSFGFYFPKSLEKPCWKDDIFKLLGSDVWENERQCTEKEINRFVREEWSSVLEIFQSGVRMLRNDGGGISHYVIKGTAYAWKKDAREYIFIGNSYAGKYHSNDESSLTSGEKLRGRLEQEELKLEYFAVNDSNYMKGIHGLYEQRE